MYDNEHNRVQMVVSIELKFGRYILGHHRKNCVDFHRNRSAGLFIVPERSGEEPYLWSPNGEEPSHLWLRHVLSHRCDCIRTKNVHTKFRTCRSKDVEGNLEIFVYGKLATL
jgi:hypothetical protein